MIPDEALLKLLKNTINDDTIGTHSVTHRNSKVCILAEIHLQIDTSRALVPNLTNSLERPERYHLVHDTKNTHAVYCGSGLLLSFKKSPL